MNQLELKDGKEEWEDQLWTGLTKHQQYCLLFFDSSEVQMKMNSCMSMYPRTKTNKIEREAIRETPETTSTLPEDRILRRHCLMLKRTTSKL